MDDIDNNGRCRGSADSFHDILKVQGRDVSGVIDQVIMN
ncbi:Uncharacterised protein [Klebsiella pneumoniae]|nr:Uncharacterised protein [Klebsiella pneumoniae]